MDETILDTITGAFVGALQQGQGVLNQFSLVLLGVFAVIAFYVQVGPLLAMGGVGASDAVGNVLMLVLKLGVFYWLVANLIPLATAAFDTFLAWGLAPTGGGAFDAASFRAPSQVLLIGARAAGALQQYNAKFTGWSALWNKWLIVPYAIAYWIILAAFALVALHLMMTIIEFHLAVMAGTVLIPWGVLAPTAFFTEFSLGWITGGLVRVFVTVAIVAIGIPLFDQVTFRTTPGGDPTLYSAVIVALTSGMFAIVSWVVPSRAAAIAGRGVSLALHAGTVVASAASGARFVMMATGAVRGISTMLRR